MCDAGEQLAVVFEFDVASARGIGGMCDHSSHVTPFRSMQSHRPDGSEVCATERESRAITDRHGVASARWIGGEVCATS